MAVKDPLTPSEILEAAATLQREKDAEYGEAWKKVGPQLAAMFPDGLVLRTPNDFARFALFFQAFGKFGRYAANFHRGGHPDSLRDLAIYAAMLESLDANPG